MYVREAFLRPMSDTILQSFPRRCAAGEGSEIVEFLPPCVCYVVNTRLVRTLNATNREGKGGYLQVVLVFLLERSEAKNKLKGGESMMKMEPGATLDYRATTAADFENRCFKVF